MAKEVCKLITKVSCTQKLDTFPLLLMRKEVTLNCRGKDTGDMTSYVRTLWKTFHTQLQDKKKDEGKHNNKGITKCHITMRYQHRTQPMYAATTYTVGRANQAVVSIRECSHSIPGQSMWDLRWTK
jgi:outer membrane protein assembly factor BamD (BamD/ComL family)